MDKTMYFTAIANALEVDLSQISMQTKMNELPEWDSLGHLSILSVLEEMTNEKASEIKNFGRLSSVSDIWDALVQAKLAG